MKLSILAPTNRTSLAACSRIAQACSWAATDIEVIVRDNSGDARKRELIAGFRRDNCRILTVDPCGPAENYFETLRQATGDFVFCVSDDDAFFDRAIGDLPAVIAQIGADPAFVGITGTYAIETAKGTSLTGCHDVDADDVAARAKGWLISPGAPVIFYSAVRRELVNRVFRAMSAVPFSFSFHDQIICMLYLLSGKFFRLQRLMYLYEAGVWGAVDTAQKRDLDFYLGAGLDPAINKLQWLLCGFEGASLIMHSDVLTMLSDEARQPLADMWFSAMYTRFKRDGRTAFDSPLTTAADDVCRKLQSFTGQLTFERILAEISGFMALSSQANAQCYFDWWDAVIHRRPPPERQPAAPRLAAVNES